MDYLVKIRSVQTPLNGQFSIGANTTVLMLISHRQFLRQTLLAIGYLFLQVANQYALNLQTQKIHNNDSSLRKNGRLGRKHRAICLGFGYFARFEQGNYFVTWRFLVKENKPLPIGSSRWVVECIKFDLPPRCGQPFKGLLNTPHHNNIELI